MNQPIVTVPVTSAEKAAITKTEHGFQYVHGPVRFEIDTQDLGKALDQADNIGQGPFKLLAEANGLDTEPWSFKLARPVVLSFVQLTWHRHRGHTEEELVKLIRKEKDRVDRYNQQLTELKKKPAVKVKPLSDKIRSGVAGTKGTGGAKGSVVYRLRPDREDIWGKFTVGQKAVLIEKLRSTGPVSSSQLATELEKGGFKATQPTERVTSFYFSEWKRNGLIEEVAAPAPAGEVTTPPPNANGAANVPAVVNKQVSSTAKKTKK